MFDRSYKKSFQEWWFYHFMRELYGYTHEEMKQFTDYTPGQPFVEGAKTRAFLQTPIPDEKDVIDDNE